MPIEPPEDKVALTAREYDHNGWFEVKGNPISKVGVFPYSGRSIDKSLEPDRIYWVYRPAEELSKEECLASFRLLPWVDKHPSKLLGPEDAGRTPAEQKGVHGITGEEVYFEDGILYANIKLFSDQLDGKINEGVRELSAGYGCTYELSSGFFNGQPYDAIQRNIRGNHLASVPEGRMGPDVAVLDHLTFTFDAKELKMAKEDEDKDMAECRDRAAKDGYKRYSRDAEEKEEKERKEAEDKAAKDKAAKDKAAKDAEEPKKEKVVEDKKHGKDEDEDKDKEGKDKKGMDAIDALAKEVAALRSNAFKSVVGEVTRRDDLARKLSGFVGAFDASEMSEQEVAKYGVEKLKVPCSPGSELAALAGYLHGRKPVTEEVGYALDSKARAKGSEDVQDFYNQAAA